MGGVPGDWVKGQRRDGRLVDAVNIEALSSDDLSEVTCRSSG